MTDSTAFKSRQQAAWDTGDFAMIARATVIVGELLCESVDLRPGQKVLDVATGSGNTALAAARRGCETTGVDWAPILLQRGRERAATERFEVAFIEGDTENLPLPGGSFDAVLSTFGAMYSPDQERTALELLRVCRAGRKIGLGNFTPESFLSEFSRRIQRDIPPPSELKSAFLWGTEERLRELFGQSVTALRLQPRTVVWRYLSAQHWLDVWRAHLAHSLKPLPVLIRWARGA